MRRARPSLSRRTTRACCGAATASSHCSTAESPPRRRPMNARWLKSAWLNTLRTRRRSGVTVGIAALGTAAILLAGGFALFTYQGLAQISARTTGHLIVAKPLQFQKDEDTPLQYGLDDVAAIRMKLLADPDVRHVLPRVEFTGLVS